MTKVELSNADRSYIKTDIRLTLLFGLLIFLVFILIFSLICFFTYGGRNIFSLGLRILGLSCIALLPGLWSILLKTADLFYGKKWVMRADYFEIIQKKDDHYLQTTGEYPKKFKLDEQLVPHIKTLTPLKIEYAAISKIILFISHDDHNLLYEIADKNGR